MDARRELTAGLFVALIAAAATTHAQTVEVSPFAGYRFGGGFYEVLSGRAVDVDGAPSVGVTINVPLRVDLHVEGLFTHQEARFTLPSNAGLPASRYRVAVDHVHVGGL